MGEQQSDDVVTEHAPIYDALASELCDPASTTWRFSPVPSFAEELLAEEEKAVSRAQ